MRRLLADSFEIEEAATREEAVELVADVGDFDVAILDMRLGRDGSRETLSGTDAIRAMHRSEPNLGVVAHGARAERHLATQALQAGAIAYVARGADADELRRAIAAAVEGERFVDPAVPPAGKRGKLTRRQRQLLQLMADGESTQFAAKQLGLSEETVKTHMKNVLARLDARNRAQAVAIALRESLID